MCVWHVCIRTHSSTPSFAYHCPSTTIIVKLFDLFPFTLVSSVFFFSAVLSVAPHVTAPYHLFPRLSRFQVRFSFFFFTRHSTNARVKAVPSFKGVCVCVCVCVSVCLCWFAVRVVSSSTSRSRHQRACFNLISSFFFFPLLLLNRVRRSSSDTFLRCVDLWV